VPGIVNRVKAVLAGRQGPPLFQLYREIGKLFRRGAVYGETTTWVFRFAPAASFAAILVALALTPMGGIAAPVIGLLAATLLVVFLVENARMPVDDPTTHLEVTMIHEVMVLDHSGPDLALIHYGAALKLWVLGLLLVGVLVPVRSGAPWADGAAVLAGMVVLAVGLGIIESVMARLRLLHVPELIVGSGALAVVAFVLTLG